MKGKRIQIYIYASYRKYVSGKEQWDRQKLINH